MKKFERLELESLIQHEDWPAISIFLPVSRIGDPQDPIRYKNILAEVESILVYDGMRTPEVRNLLEQEYQLVKNSGFWQHLGVEGLAVFLSRQRVLRYPLPAVVKEQIAVGRRFHIRPLLPLFTEGPYVVLALSRDKIRLFWGDWYHLTEFEPPGDTPGSMSEALKYYDPGEQLQFYTKKSTTVRKHNAMFHGQGVGVDDQNDNIVRFLQAVDRSLFPLLEDKKVPVILAGSEETLAAYKRISKCNTLLAQTVTGNVSELSADELYPRAKKIADDYFKKKERHAIQKFRDNLDGSRSIDELQSILTAAVDGRVETLFLADKERLWGTFDLEKRSVRVQQQDGDQIVDLLDEAMFWTLRKKGVVYLEERDSMPIDTKLCAQLRY